MDKMEPERVVLQKVSVRLPPEMIEAMDRSIKNGLAHNRSEIIRKAVEALRNLAGPLRQPLVDFLTQVLSEPLEYWFWLSNRFQLFMLDDAQQRLYAGRMTSIIKTAGRMTGTDKGLDYGEIRQRILDAISNFQAPEGFSTVMPDERVIQIPTSDAPLPPTEDPPLSRGFDTFISRIAQRIEASATAEEVAHKIVGLVCLAGVEVCYGAADVDPGLGSMAAAADIPSFILNDEGQPDPTALADAYDTWVLTVPVLYDKMDLREEVKSIVVGELTEAPSEESETPQETSEVQDEESQVPV